MKHIILLITTTIFSVVLLKAQQGIGVTNPDASSALEISSTIKGMLIPRMTTVQMNAISSPANGLMIYNTTDSCVYIRRISSWISTCSPTFSMAWGLLGNSGTVDGTNFIGTTDNTPLSIKVNNQKAGRIDPTNTNAFFGYQAGNVIAAFGTNNTFVGHQAGVANTSGRENLFIGYQAGNTNTTAIGNHFVGFQAGYGNTSGTSNHADGYQAGYGLSTGSYNTFSGFQAGYATSSGFENVAMGHNALKAHTTTNGNVSLGAYSMFSTVTGGDNVAIGRNAIRASTGASYNVAIGGGAIGASALTGNYNSALGNIALAHLTSGTYNVAIGASALTENTTGTQNIAIGGEAGLNNLGGSNNVIMGYQAARNGTAHANSTIIGYQSGMATTGGNNTFLGFQTGTTNTTGSSNTLLGYNTNVSGAAFTNATAIGANATVGASNSLVLGSSVNVGMGTSAPSANLHLYGNGTSGFTPTGGILPVAATAGPEIAFSRGGFGKPGATIQMLDYNSYSSGLAFNVHKGTNNGGTGVFADNWPTDVIQAMTIDNQGRIGIGTTAPLYKLDIDAQTGSSGNPLRLLGLNAGATSDSIISSNAGVLRRLSINQVLGNAWNILGNSGTTAPTSIGLTVGANNFIGTTNASNLALATNSLTRMILDQNGNAYGGSNSTLVDPSVTSSLVWGDNNKLYGINSLVAGTTNIDSSRNSFVFGNNNILGSGLGYTAGNRSNRGTILGGGQNTVTAGETYNAIINGSQNTVTGDCFESIINGYQSTVTSSQKIITTGQWNTLTNATYSAVFGIGNTVSATHNLVTGRSNTINTGSNYSVALGETNTIAASHLNSMVVGKDMTTTTSAQFMAGFTGGFRFHTNSTTNSSVAITNVGYVGIGTAAPNQQLEITNAFRFPQTTSSTIGVIYKGSNRFIHDYKPTANDGFNTFVGQNAGNFTMSSATSWLASGNTGVGTNALTALTEGGFNTAIGRNAMTAMTTGSYNVALGSFALATNTTGTSNTAIGHNALNITTSSNNTAVGGSVLAFNTTGYSNTSIGESSMNKSTIGYQNTALGQSALRENLTGNNNVALGLSALLANTSGSSNIAIGVSALVASTTSDGNTIVGHSAMSSTTSASNVAVGYLAGTGTTSGGSNTFVGYETGTTNTTGANNTLLGYQANVSSAALTNATAIGNGATVTASNKIRLGNASVTLVETYGSFVTISDRRLKTNIADNNIGLNFIKAVRPVQYELKDQKGLVYDGFIAQEIDSILQKQGIKNFSGLSKPQNTEGGYFTVSYATFVVPLVNAVKELDEKNEKALTENAKMKAELDKLKAENAALKAGLDKNSQDIEAIKAMLNQKQH